MRWMSHMEYFQSESKAFWNMCNLADNLRIEITGTRFNTIRDWRLCMIYELTFSWENIRYRDVFNNVTVNLLSPGCECSSYSAKYHLIRHALIWNLSLLFQHWLAESTEYCLFHVIFTRGSCNCFTNSPIFTARIRRMGRGNIFSFFACSHLGGGVPHPADRGVGYHIPGLDGGGYPIHLMGGTTSQVWTGGAPHPADWGVPPSQVWMGGTPSSWWGGGCPIPGLTWGGGVPPSQLTGSTPFPGLEGGTPSYPDAGVPPSQVWTGGTPLAGGAPSTRPAQHVLATWRAVCLLRSRRRTFLL